MFVKIFRKMPNSRNEGYIVAEFYDGIQVIPKTWLQSEEIYANISHIIKQIREFGRRLKKRKYQLLIGLPLKLFGFLASIVFK